MNLPMEPTFRRYLLLSCYYITEKFIQEKYEGCKLMLNSHELKQLALSIYWYPCQSFSVDSQQLIFSVGTSTNSGQYSLELSISPQGILI